MGKGEIARYEQFLLFPQCFQKACLPGTSKGVIVLEWVKTPYNQSISFLINQSINQSINRVLGILVSINTSNDYAVYSTYCLWQF